MTLDEESLPERVATGQPVHRGKLKTRGWIALLASLALFLAFLLLRPRISHANAVTSGPEADSLTVAVTPVTREDIAREVVFDSELRPYQEIDLRAKVSGFVRSITVDVGDHVKEGQLIAELELPEIEHDLERAAAAQRRAAQQIRRAQAAWDEARGVLDRMANVEKAQPNLIAQQEIDTASAKERGAEADLAAARDQESAAAADVNKLKTMLQYARITAPFEGIVTKRYADRGALIQAGTTSSTQALPLIRLSQNNLLRLVFPVMESYVASVKEGEPVQISIPSLNRKLAAKITRSAQRVDFATRTMETEVDIPNADYSLIPGIYASVTLPVERKSNALVAPVSAISRKGESATAYVITRNGVVEDRSVKLGVESPFKVEIISGLNEGDLLLVGNRSGVKPGQHVTPKVVSTDPLPLS